MRIPLPKMMRFWRQKEFELGKTPAGATRALKLWAFVARRPRLYRYASRIGIAALRLYAGRRSSLAALPLAGAWTAARDLPVPEGGTFMAQWRGGKGRLSR